MAAELPYIIYLAHWAGIQWFYGVIGPFSERLLVAATCFTLVPIASWVVWKWIDRPLNDRRAEWVRSRMHGPAGKTALHEPAGP